MKDENMQGSCLAVTKHGLAILINKKYQGLIKNIKL
jgi:hypothetical protein